MLAEWTIETSVLLVINMVMALSIDSGMFCMRCKAVLALPLHAIPLICPVDLESTGSQIRLMRLKH